MSTDTAAPQVVIDGGMTPRHYQMPYMRAMDNGCRFAVWVMHRRGGKDRTALAQACKMAFQRPGLYWHCLPTLKQGRKVVWDNITSEGKNLIDQTFAKHLVKRRLEDEMKVELANGSIVQIVGADNFNALVGASPVHVTFSEWSLTDPRAYDFVRPILRENGGSVSFIYTPRGYNHGHSTLEIARKLPGAFVAVMSIRDTGVLTDADMQMERAQGMAEELIQQEFYCDFSSANVGAIVGKYVAQAERDGRINEDTQYSPGSRIVVSSDIGYRDSAAWWFWQLKLGGFDLIHYMEGSGLDAPDWIDRLKNCGIPISHLYLPHDARAKTMATKYSVIEQMSHEFECSIVPQTKLADRINAARVVIPRCNFAVNECARGLEALRAWSFRFDDERKIFSAEPTHDWASHGADAFSYGAQVVNELVREVKTSVPKDYAGTHYPFGLDDLFAAQEARPIRL
jgi:phage terminase large subunit